MRSLTASQAYSKSATHRGIREQESDVFRRVTARLRQAQQSDTITRARAVCDNERLWITVMDVVRDPTNQLEPGLRASLVSVGYAVRRECMTASPDLPFLIAINDQVTAGLAVPAPGR